METYGFHISCKIINFNGFSFINQKQRPLLGLPIYPVYQRKWVNGCLPMLPSLRTRKICGSGKYLTSCGRWRDGDSSPLWEMVHLIQIRISTQQTAICTLLSYTSKSPMFWCGSDTKGNLAVQWCRLLMTVIERAIVTISPNGRLHSIGLLAGAVYKGIGQ